MTKYNFDKTKGQSAIEYLMTYGWMLLVVAIVGGAIFATVQGQCTQTTSGLSGGDVLVESFGRDSNGDLQMEIRNGGANSMNITNATVLNPNGADIYNDSGLDVEVSSSNTITLSTGNSMESTEGCNDYDVEFNYDYQGGLSDQVTTGTLTDSIEFAN